MLHIFKTAIAVALAVILTLGAVYNRNIAEVSLGPVFPTLEAPLYLITYIALGFGLFLGLLFGWLHYGPIGRWSRERQKKKRDKVKQANKILKEAKKDTQKEGGKSTPLDIAYGGTSFDSDAQDDKGCDEANDAVSSKRGFFGRQKSK